MVCETNAVYTYMSTDRMPITPEVITWAREWSGYTQEAVAAIQRFRKIADWECGVDSPTFRQLEELSDKFKVPMAVFFFPEPPKVEPVRSSFRTLGSAQFAQIPPSLHLLLRKAKALQIALAELNDHSNQSNRIITRHLSLDLSGDIEAVASQTRVFLGVTIDEQFSWPDAHTAFEHWRTRFYEAGVYVFKDAFGKDHHDYSGFCLHDSEFPIIYINNSTSKTRQVFTLLHELAHLLYATSGFTVPDHLFLDSLNIDNRRVEVRCNLFASRTIVPDDALDSQLELLSPELSPRSLAEVLAGRFGVSREVIYRRFVEREIISSEEYEIAKVEWDGQFRQKNGAGNYYNTKLSYLGKEFVSLAFERFYEHRISELDLADYLDVKPRNLSKLEDAFVKKMP